MTETNNRYKFLSSGRELITYGSDLISIGENGLVYSGYDQSADIQPYMEDIYLTDDEKKELAEYMMEKWAKWAGIRHITTY